MTISPPQTATPTRRRAIRNRLLVSVAVLVVSAVGLTFAGQWILAETITSVSSETERTNRLAEAEEQLHLSLIRQETLVLGHALSPDESTIEAFEAAAESEAEAYLALARIAPDDEALAAAAELVRERATAWREEWAEPYLRDSGEGEVRFTFAEGERLFAPVDEALLQLEDVTEARLDRALTDLSDVVADMNAFFIPVVVIMAAFITLAGVSLARSISGPLGRLNDAAQAVIAGADVTFAPERDDEIGALAVVLERLRLDAAARYAATRVQAETAATFNQLSELTSFAQDEETLVDAAARVLRRAAPSPRGTIMLLNNSTNRLIVVAAWGDGTPEVGSAAAVERIDSCPGIRRATAYVAQDLSDALAVRCPAHPAESGTLVCLPMPALGSTVGVIHLEHSEPRAFDGDIVTSAARIAEQVAMAIANARLMKTMEGLANTDPLTGLRNARYFDAHLERELALVEPDGLQVGVIMLDVDHFKKFNDTYGHPAGDEALRSLSRTLRTVVRAGDIVARYGGEEFIVALHDAPLADAQAVAEKIRLAVEQNAFEIGPGRFGRITISLGVVSTDAYPLEQKALVALADAALYRAKEDGRNRVETPPTSQAELDQATRRRRTDLRPADEAGDEPIALPVAGPTRGSRRKRAGTGPRDEADGGR